MSQGLEMPLQGNDEEHASFNSNNKKNSQNKTESKASYVAMKSPSFHDQNQNPKKSKHKRNRSLSIGSMTDGNKRMNLLNGTSIYLSFICTQNIIVIANDDADFFRFPQQKTLLFQSNNIGLYSPLVSTRLRQIPAAIPQRDTIYDGVPSYLNPNLMRQRNKRSNSEKKINENIHNQTTQIQRSKSEKTYNHNHDHPNFIELNDFNKSPKLSIQMDENSNHQQKINRKSSTKKYQQFNARNMDEIDTNQHITEWNLHSELIKSPDSSHHTLLEDVSSIWKRAYFALIILGILNGLLTFCISKTASQVWLLESLIYEYAPFQMAQSAPSYLLIILLKITLVLTAIWLTRSFAPGCAGSGVPELRAILSGIWIRYYLSKMTFFIKTIALTLSLSSGIPIGLEGPFIHLSAIMGRQLTKLSIFKHLDRRTMLSAACAGGLASVFGAPIGGVLFSIEVTSTYYPVSNYWTAVCCACVGSTMTRIFQSLSPTSLLLYQTNFSESEEPFVTKEFLYFALLGVICGIMATFFVYLHDFYVDLRRKYQSKLFLGDNPYGIAAIVIILFSTILFFIGDFAIEPARKAVADMFNIEYLNNCDESVFNTDSQCNNCECVQNIIDVNPTQCDGGNDSLLCQQNDYCSCYYHDWIINSGLYWNLSLFYCLNYLFTICTVTLSIPCGLFSPIFTLGSVLGRIFGEVFRHWFSFPDPRIYSVVGAAAMAAGVTQTISPAVIALEITGDLSLAVPCLIAVIVSVGISTTCIHSFYDSVLQLRGIPMLPIRPTVSYRRMFKKNGDAMVRYLVADDVMFKEFCFVTIDPSASQLVDVLTANVSQEWFPIVHTISESVLVGEVRRSVLMDLLRIMDEDKYENEIPNALRMNHKSTKNLELEMSERKGSENKEESIKITLMSHGFIERINLSPIQVISEMPLTKIYTLFHILKPQNVYVTKYSRLIGVINEVQLLNREFKTQKASKQNCLKCNICRR